VAEDERSEPGIAGEATAGPAGEGAALPAAGEGPLVEAGIEEEEQPGLRSLAAAAFYSPSTRLVLVAASVVVIIFGMKQAASVVTPVLLSLVITMAITPLLTWQVRKGVNRSVAFLTTLIAAAVVGGGAILLLMTSLAKFIADLPSYADELEPYWDALLGMLESIGIDTADLASLKNVDPQKILETGASLANAIVDTISGLSLMALTVLFMLMEASTITTKLKNGVAGDALRRMADVTTDMRSFIKVTAVMGAVVAVLDTILLLAVGVPNALLWGFLSFFLSFIPFIGFIIAMIPPTIMALITGGWEAALIVLAGYLIMNTISDNLVKPRVMGTETNLSPLTVFLSVMLWGWVLGPVGGLLAVPVTLLAKRLILEAYDEWKWFAIVIGDVPKEDKPKERRHGLGRIRPHRSNKE
jgi:AI-2 transport protein TqsA